MLETATLQLRYLYVISGEQGMVDEAQKALEEAEALKKVCFFRKLVFCLVLISELLYTSYVVEMLNNSVDTGISLCLGLYKWFE